MNLEELKKRLREHVALGNVQAHSIDEPCGCNITVFEFENYEAVIHEDDSGEDMGNFYFYKETADHKKEITMNQFILGSNDYISKLAYNGKLKEKESYLFLNLDDDEIALWSTFSQDQKEIIYSMIKVSTEKIFKAMGTSRNHDRDSTKALELGMKLGVLVETILDADYIDKILESSSKFLDIGPIKNPTIYLEQHEMIERLYNDTSIVKEAQDRLKLQRTH